MISADLLPYGRAPGVAQVDQVLVGQRLQDGVQDGEPAHSGVEDADGGVAVHRGACPNAGASAGSQATLRGVEPRPHHAPQRRRAPRRCGPRSRAPGHAASTAACSAASARARRAPAELVDLGRHDRGRAARRAPGTRAARAPRPPGRAAGRPAGRRRAASGGSRRYPSTSGPQLCRSAADPTAKP